MATFFLFLVAAPPKMAFPKKYSLFFSSVTAPLKYIYIYTLYIYIYICRGEGILVIPFLGGVNTV